MLKVDNLDVSYGHAQVLHQISLEINQGEMVFVVGRNGAGKTTLLKTICGLLKPKSGGVYYKEQQISGLPAEDVAGLGIRYVAQDKQVFQSLTVRENLEMAAYASGKDIREAASEAVKLYPSFEKMLDLKAGSLSGGQREILLIARALVSNPELILVDEPTEGLASIVIEDIVSLLAELKGNLSGLIVEQNLNVLASLADRVYVMKEGYMIRELREVDEIKDLEALGRFL